MTGDNPVNATAYSNTLDGTNYAGCTTMQYGYKPCSNSTVLTANPQSTLATTPTKLPEEMQKETEQDGGLSFWHEFSWWYPWYRLHIKIHINPTLDVGFSPLLPEEGNYASSNDLWEFFLGVMGDFGFGFGKMLISRILAYMFERPLDDFSAFLTSTIFFGIGLALMSTDWDNKPALLGGAIAALIALVGVCTRKLAPFMKNMATYILAHPQLKTLVSVIAQFAEKIMGMIQCFIRKIVDLAEAIYDAVLALIAAVRASQL